MATYNGSGVLRPGDVVIFDSADTWLVTGTQGLYLVGGVTYIGDTWGVGTRATIRANADLEAGVVRFRDHPTLETVFKGFEVDANGKVASGIDINHAFYSLMTGATKRVQNAVVHHVWSRVALGQFKYGIIISNHGGSNGLVENVEIIDTVVHDVSRDAICLYPGDEFVNSRIRNITVRGSEAFNTGQDPDYCCGAGILVKGYVQDAIVEFNYVHDVKGASMFVNGNETNHYPGLGPTNVHIRHNIFTNATVHGAIRVYDGASGGDPKKLKNLRQHHLQQHRQRRIPDRVGPEEHPEPSPLQQHVLPPKNRMRNGVRLMIIGRSPLCCFWARLQRASLVG